MNKIQIACANYNLYYRIILPSGNLYIDAENPIFYISCKLSDDIVRNELNEAFKKYLGEDITFKIIGREIYKRIYINDGYLKHKFINFLSNQNLCFYNMYTGDELDTHISNAKIYNNEYIATDYIDAVFENNKLINANVKKTTVADNLTIFFKKELFEKTDL